MRSQFNFLVVIALISGFLAGTFTNLESDGNYFAGYYYSAASRNGVLARLSYGDPEVPISGFSTEWVMAVGQNSSRYIQAGWMKNYEYSPRYFIEYMPGCGSYCRIFYGEINTNSHEYRVSVESSKWCGYIDGSKKTCVATSSLGFSTTANEQFFGETTEPSIQLGGSSESHYRMTRLSIRSGSTWSQVNTNNLTQVISSDTSYNASKGYTSPDTWMDNWTE